MLQKQNLNINFSQGLDTKTDPFQVSPGKFLNLQNSIFTKAGLLQKRNGYQRLSGIFNQASVLSTYSGGLVGIGNSLEVYSADTQTILNRGAIQPLSLSTMPVVRTSTNVTLCDVAVASNGLACAVYTDNSTNSYYQVFDSITGTIVVSITQLPATAALPRVFFIGYYLIITYLVTVVASTHLQYIAIPINNPTSPSIGTDLSSNARDIACGYDGVVSNNNLYVAYADSAAAIKVTYIDSTLLQHNTATLTGVTASLISLAVDSNYVLWVTAWSDITNDINIATFSPTLVQILSRRAIVIALSTVARITAIANAGVMTLFYEITNAYSYDLGIPTNYIRTITVTQPGVIGTPTTIIRSLGLASKAFYLSSTSKAYVLGAYYDTYQPSYFLIDQSGIIVAKLSYSNGGGYMTTQVLPSANVSGNEVQIGYLYKDLLDTAIKTQGSSSAPIGALLGVNLATFTIGNVSIQTSEIGNDLHLTGGVLWMFDGALPVEHGFYVFPASIEASWSATGGSIVAKPDGSTNTNAYFYQVTYEWTDAQGNVHRSAPSIPIGVTTTDGGSTGSITLHIPYLRLTAKVAPNPVRICIYRWSVAQQSYYQVTSITSPQINSTTSDSFDYVDTQADASILGHLLIYTTGGVVEDVAAPACAISTLYKSRLFLVDSEDQNLLWYSKQVIEATPVEMSDLFTFYVAPTQGAQGSTGPITALSSMDDKLIIFKKDAIYYIVGNGPDNTGANNDFSEPVFITSTVGCANPSSIVFIPQGLLFQSDKGIWLLGRDLSTSYFGAPVEQYNSATVLSSIGVPGTNQARFTLNNGITLMYDYFYGQWGTFTNIPAISSTIYGGLHTYLDQYGHAYQETPQIYLDNSSPVLMSFTTSWFNLSGLQGYQRAYYFYLLGTYFSPHKLSCQIAYDYEPSPSQVSVITPNNFAPAYGVDINYGSGSPYGGPGQLEQWRVFLSQQRCESFQITINELYDPSYQMPAGAGLTVSGLNLVFGIKKGWKPMLASQGVG